MAFSFRSAKIVIRCAHLDASHAFYMDVLGLELAERWEEPQGRGLIVSLGDRAPGASIEMYEMSSADPRFDPRFREPVPSDKIDLQLETDSVDAWADRLRGRWPFEGPEDLPWGQRWIRLRDPDGLPIAIYKKSPTAVSENASSGS
jgi:catechol 2,3-dioxygenase-like lactoylglutathione lyase family enzyme